MHVLPANISIYYVHPLCSGSEEDFRSPELDTQMVVDYQVGAVQAEFSCVPAVAPK